MFVCVVPWGYLDLDVSDSVYRSRECWDAGAFDMSAEKVGSTAGNFYRSHALRPWLMGRRH